MNRNWFDTGYLAKGNNRQKECFKILSDLNIFTILSDYSPVLTGTIPINIDIPESDLDIICDVSDFDLFQNTVKENYSHHENFRQSLIDNIYIANFLYSGTEIEIYAQNKPTISQNAYIHMVIEYRILNISGEVFRQKIIELKKSGIKTEPAFGLLLNLTNPFDDLIMLSKLNDDQLADFLNKKYPNTPY